MRFPRFRLTIRRLMILIAVIGAVSALAIRTWMNEQDRLQTKALAIKAQAHFMGVVQAETDREDAEARATFAEMAIERRRQRLEKQPGNEPAREKLTSELREWERKRSAAHAKADKAGRMAKYHDEMRAKYAAATAHPRRPVPPDPPEPE